MYCRWLLLICVVCSLLPSSNFAESQNRPKVIGVLMSGTAKATMPYIEAFIRGMSELGWTDGKTAQYIMRFDEDDKSRLPKLAAELVALHVDVLASTSVATPAARTATTTIPIVAMDTYDPIEEGLTRSLGTPIGNVTGASGQSGESAAKRVELAHDLIPGLQRIALITDPGDIGATIDAQSSRAAAARLGLDFRAFEVHHARDYPVAFAAIKRYRPQALMVTTSTLTIDNLEQTASFASINRLPAFSAYSSFAEAGFLLTYGVGYVHLFKLAARQVDKILKGAKPANLPWAQPTEFELAINMKAAKALGLSIPESIMVGATKVIR
jgi:putative tryptophan/tyrosine transport system substrate-binding protein